MREVQAEVQVTGAGARGLAVLLKTEAGAVIGLTSTGDTRGGVLTKTGSGSGLIIQVGVVKIC